LDTTEWLGEGGSVGAKRMLIRDLRIPEHRQNNFVFIYLFLVVLGFEFKASHLLGNLSYHLTHSLALFLLVSFLDKVSRFCPSWP
jgi:hypothetical protein